MSRPRGYADWNPQAETLDLIGNIRSVLDEYRDHLPLTVRQIFYRLVGAYNFEKTEKAYGRLCEHMVRARRAEMIPFSSIRDDGTSSSYGESGYADTADFWDRVRNTARYYRRDPSEGQPVRVELWCEAKGMAPQLARVANPYGVDVFATGGFSSVTVTHEIAQRAIAADVPTIFLHVGDFDPSGESIFDAMSTDAAAFIRGEGAWWADDGNERFETERVALTAEQVERHDLPTAPPKRTDTRSRSWIGETCQAEAMPPDLLAETVREAVEARLDLGVLADVHERAEIEREDLMERLKVAMEGVDDE